MPRYPCILTFCTTEEQSDAFDAFAEAHPLQPKAGHMREALDDYLRKRGFEISPARANSSGHRRMPNGRMEQR